MLRSKTHSQIHIQARNNKSPGKENTTIKALADRNNPEDHISIQDGTDTPLIPKCEADMNLIILIGLLHWRLA